jgi:predicted MPP superfamily phosphohydrolase
MPPTDPSDKLQAILQKTNASRQTRQEQQRRYEEERRSSDRFIKVLNEVRNATPDSLAGRARTLGEALGDANEMFYPRWVDRFQELGVELNSAGLQYQLGELDAYVQRDGNADAGQYAVSLIRLAGQQDREQMDQFLRAAEKTPDLHQGVRMWLQRLGTRLIEMRKRLWVDDLAELARPYVAGEQFQHVWEAVDRANALLPQSREEREGGSTLEASSDQVVEALVHLGEAIRAARLDARLASFTSDNEIAQGAIELLRLSCEGDRPKLLQHLRNAGQRGEVYENWFRYWLRRVVKDLDLEQSHEAGRHAAEHAEAAQPLVAVPGLARQAAPVSGRDRGKASFAWLHLTDLHFGMPDQKWLWPNMRQAFIDDLERLHKKAGPWDMVLFTGDFVQRGGADEFKKLNEMLAGLWQHLRMLGSDPVLLGVPGNHDLVRPRPADSTVTALRTGWGDKHLQQEFWTKPKSSYRKVIQKAFKNYLAWWNAHALPRLDSHRPGLLPGDFSATIEKDAVKLGVVGLNTTFLQLEGGNYDGKLAISPQQFHRACGDDGAAWAREHNLCILLTHQPPHWLTKESREELYGEIALPGRFAAHLFGHMHEPAARSVAQGGAETRREWQGCSLFGLEEWGDGSSEKRRLHGYSAGRVELEADRAFIREWPRKAEPHQAGHLQIVPDPSFTLEEDEGTRPEQITLTSPVAGA